MRLVTPGTDTETQLAQSRRSIMRQWAQDTRRRAGGRPALLHGVEHLLDPRDPRHDEPYAAAFVAKTALEASGIADGYSFWTFSDIFEENYFPSVPFHGGFGLLDAARHSRSPPIARSSCCTSSATNGSLVDGLHHTVDAWVVRQKAGVTILLTNHALPRHPIRRERVRVTLRTFGRPRSASIRRIDEGHANAATRLAEARGARVLSIPHASNGSKRPRAFARTDVPGSTRIGLRISRSICPLTPWHPSR